MSNQPPFATTWSTCPSLGRVSRPNSVCWASAVVMTVSSIAKFSSLAKQRASAEHVCVEDLPRYVKDGYKLVIPEMTAKLDELVRQIEAQKISFKGWATPGANLLSAALDVARTIGRRAERRACALQEAGQLQNPEIIIYLNRLSDTLWLLARWVETRSAGGREESGEHV